MIYADDGAGLLILKAGAAKAVPIEDLVRAKKEAAARAAAGATSPPPKPDRT